MSIINKYAKLFIYIIVIILLNLVSTTLFFRIDLTENNIFSISETSKKVISTLSEPLTIKIFFTKNLPAPHNNTERYLHDLLEEYAICSNKYFNYRFYNVSLNDEGVNSSAMENQELADNYGIPPVQLQVFEKDEVKFKKAYMGIVLIHGDMIEKIPAITSTNGLEYKLTTAMMKLNNKTSALLSLSDKIKVKLFLSSSLKDVAPFMGLKELSEYPHKIKSIVETLNGKAYGNMEYLYIDPATEQNRRSEWEKYNLMSLKWPDLSNGKIPAGSGIIGMVMEYNDKIREIPVLNVIRIPIIGTQYDMVSLDKMEEVINANMERLVDINEYIGYLTDHGTFKVSSFPSMERHNPDSLYSFSTLVSQNYSFKHINLKDSAIPDSLKCLVIARPTEEFTDYELFQIDQALMRGTNLAIFLDAFKETLPDNKNAFQFNQGPTYAPLNTGLEKLLNHYGIKINKSFIMDENCYKQQLQRQFGGGESHIYFAPVIKNKYINYDLEFMKNIKGMVVVKISPLELDEKIISDNGLNAYKLFSSSEKSWKMSESINLNPLFLRPPSSATNQQSYPLAYLLEGEFPSYFAGKSIPEKISDDVDAANGNKNKASAKDEYADLSKVKDKGSFYEKSQTGKIFLIASSEILKDSILNPDGESPNEMFIMNVLDALNDREDIAVMRSKIQNFNPLNDTQPATKAFIKTFNIIGLPIFVFIVGLIVWMRRHSKKKQIQMMFGKHF